MASPEDDPIGAKPILPPPAGDAAARGTQLFRQMLELNRGESPATSSRAPSRMLAPASPIARDTGSRRYDVALSVVARAVPAPPHDVPVQEQAELPAPVDDEPTGAFEAEFMSADETGPTETASRPPPGAPTVRPSAPAARPVDTIPQDILETAADTALLSSDEAGRTCFDISFRDELFENLTCRITIDDGRVVAVFRVQDANTRRLLEAEAGRLRASLEERGLRVTEILVQGD